MGGREAEAKRLARCLALARGQSFAARDQEDANLFRVAAMLLRTHFPDEAMRLRDASEGYFNTHPEDLLPVEEILHRGWVVGLPRFRDQLSRALRGGER